MVFVIIQKIKFLFIYRENEFSFLMIVTCRFPKTKKALMNEWLNETVDPVMPVGSPSGVTEVHSTGVPTCYMRSPATPLRRSTSVNQVVPGTILNLDLPGGSAKKRWLRQAISEETESPHFNGLCPSPNSRPGGCRLAELAKHSFPLYLVVCPLIVVHLCFSCS